MRKQFLAVLACALGVASAAEGGGQPVDGLPTYNGTYWGSPNTGSTCDSSGVRCDSLAGRKMFTTLYRDNYERTSGCAGERCGKHPGVDIAVLSGTAVRAALGGTIYRKESCNPGWGGLVVVEAVNPYRPSEKVYVGYAHLRRVYVSEGQTIPEGYVLGESGGAASDSCRGASTGAHLHFQVDKPHGGPYPWFPTGQVEQPDTSFAVTGKTHNPLPFVTGFAYNFTFAEESFKELWGAANVNSYDTDNSDLWVDSESTRPYIGRSSFFGDASSCGEGVPCSREVTIDADLFSRLILRLHFECVSNPVTVYFRGPDDRWHGGSFNYTRAGKYTLNMSGLSGWRGIVTDLVVRLSRGCTAAPGPEEYFVRQAYLTP